MTKKHFEWAARWIAQRSSEDIWSEEEVMAMIAFAITFFSTFNHKFSREMFIDAFHREEEKNESIRA